jgi:hypothetical protein
VSSKKEAGIGQLRREQIRNFRHNQPRTGHPRPKAGNWKLSAEEFAEIDKLTRRVVGSFERFTNRNLLILDNL